MENYNKLLKKAKEAYSKCVTDAEKRRLEAIFPELKEVSDEKIRKEILDYFKDLDEHGYPTKEWIAWIEKQEERENFFNKIQVSDKVTRNEDGVIVNLSQLERVVDEDKEEEQSTNTLEWTKVDTDTLTWICRIIYHARQDKLITSSDETFLAKWIDKWLNYNPEWKEQDRKMLESIIDCIDGTGLLDSDQIDWIKSLKPEYKNTVENDKALLEKQDEQKLAWSDEDEYQINTILHGLNLKKEIYKKRGNKVEEDRYNTQYNWLKSFEARYKEVVECNKTLLENQNKDDKVIFPKFTFDDVLALECCMKEVEKKDEKLYNQLQSLHNRVHDVYWLDREGEKKETLCDKCRKEQPCHSCQDITELGRCALEHHRELVDKNKPKFKVGDWIYKGCNILKIRCIGNEYYCFETEYGYINDLPISKVDSLYHLWTIEDAKDGDVVVDKSNGAIGIFQSIGHDPDGGSHNDPSYCFLHCRYVNGFFYADFENGNMIDADDLIPAIKEQRDILFAKMAEAGYEWDPKNKSLGKQCNKELNNLKSKFKVGDWIVHNGVGVYKIVEVCESWYEVISYNNDGIVIQYSIGFDKENDCRLWTIQDAKNGDVLANTARCILIANDNKSCLCYLDKNEKFHAHNNKWFFSNFSDNVLTPATKEQRDLLFSKMKEAGYEWDSENKSLRKQCNQESIDKVDPKFKIGDWIACDGLITAIIVNIDGDRYEVEFIDGDKGFPHIDYVDRLFHHWTIEDADYGDVLAGHEYYVIFKEIDGLNIKCHCAYHYMGYNTSFYVETLQNKAAFHPATREQRDALFQKIKENGYEWDTENKSLRKQCNQEPINKVIPKFKVGDKVLWKYNKSVVRTVKEVSKYGTYWIECQDCSSGWWSEQDLEPYDNQDKQEPTIGINPKFHKGQWIFCKGFHPALIINIVNDKYEIEFTDNGAKGFHPIALIDKHYHPWTIKDAKEGDVLVWDDSKCLALFKNIYDKESFCSYGLVGHCTEVFENRASWHDIEGAHPATKEQRDLFFQKMKDAGYEWDSEKKELNKI